MQRPTGITILALVHFLAGGISLVMSCFAMAVSRRLIETNKASGNVPSVLEQDLALRGNPVFWIGLLGTGASLFKLGAAAGLWTLQPWGRQLALISGTLKLLTHLVSVIQGAITPSGVLGVLVNGAVLLYLSMPHVRQALSGVPIATPTTAR